MSKISRISSSPLPEITFQILSYLTPGDLARYSRVSKATRAESAGFQQVAYNLSQVLSRFFSDQEITQFRVIQAVTGMLISGSIALQFLQRELYANSDLDLYVEHCFAYTVGHFLMSLNYSFDPSPGQNPQFDVAIVSIKMGIQAHPMHQYSVSHVAGVYNFVKGDGQKIQLITAILSPLDIILNFHSTVVMNVISHSHAYFFYPRATFEENISLVCSSNEGPDRDRSLQKYIERGWTIFNGQGMLWGEYAGAQIVDRDDPRDHLAMFQIGKERRLGDTYTWTLPLIPILKSQAPAEKHPRTFAHKSILLPPLSWIQKQYQGLQLLEANCWMLEILSPQDEVMNALPMPPEPVAIMIYESVDPERLSLRHTYCVLERFVEHLTMTLNQNWDSYQTIPRYYNYQDHDGGQHKSGFDMSTKDADFRKAVMNLMQYEENLKYLQVY